MWTQTFRRREEVRGLDKPARLWEIRETTSSTVIQFLIADQPGMWKWQTTIMKDAMMLPPKFVYRRVYVNGHVVNDDESQTEGLFLAHLDGNDCVVKMDLVKEMSQ